MLNSRSARRSREAALFTWKLPCSHCAHETLVARAPWHLSHAPSQVNKANEEAAKCRREAERLAEALRRSEAEVAGPPRSSPRRGRTRGGDYRCGQLEEAL